MMHRYQAEISIFRYFGILTLLTLTAPFNGATLDGAVNVAPLAEINFRKTLFNF